MLKDEVFQALGEASMCWEPIPTGVFDSSRAEKIGENLIAEIKQSFKDAVPEENLPPAGSLEDKYGYLAGQRKGFNLCRTQTLTNIEGL